MVVERSSDYYNDQLGSSVAVAGCNVYSWNKYNPIPYNDSDYWYLQSLATGSPSTAWGQFNTGEITPKDNYDLRIIIVYYNFGAIS